MAEPTRTNKRTGEVQAFRNGQWVTTTKAGTGAPAFSVQNKPADPTIPFKTTEARNNAAASQYDPAKAAADVKIAEAQARIAEANAGVINAKNSADLQTAQANLAKAQAELQKMQTGKGSALNALQTQMDRVGELYRQNLKGGLPNQLNDFIPFQSGKDAFDSAAQGLTNPFQAAFKVEGQGSQSDTELRQFLQANTPAQGDSDAVIEEKLRNIQTRIDAEKGVQQQPPAPPQAQAPDNIGLAQGASRNEIDPVLKAAGQRVGRMIADGVSDDKIRDFLQSSGIDPASTNVGQALQYRNSKQFKDWQRANPGKAYPIGPDFYTREVPMSGGRQIMNTVSQSAPAAFAASAGNAVTGGRLDNIVGSFGGDPEMARTGMQLLRAQNPGSSFAGDLAGQAMVETTVGRIPGIRGLAATRWGRRGNDLAYGAYSGSGEMDGNAGMGALAGAAANAVGGMFGRSLQRGGGRALTGVRNANLSYLNNAGVPLTIGQIGRGSDNVVGTGVAGFEERAVGLPIADAIIGSARRRGDEGFNREMFRQLGQPNGVAGSGAIGIPGLAEARGTRDAAYSFLDSASLQRDPVFDAANAATAGKVSGLPDFNGQVERKLGLVDGAFDAAGVMSGRNWQNSIRSLRRDRGKIGSKEFGQEAANILGEAENNLSGLVQRQIPGGTEALGNANAIHSNYKTVQGALKGRVAQRNGVLTDPTTLNDVSIRGAEKFGGLDNALEGKRPFYELTKAGMDVMPNLTPDSGTAGRSLFYAALPSILGGGAGAAYGGLAEDTSASEGAQTGAGIGAAGTILPTLALASLYSKGGQKAIQRAMLGPRNQHVERLGKLLIDHPRFGGMFGSSVMRDFFLQNELEQ